MKAVNNAPFGLRQGGAFEAHGPAAVQAPGIELGLCRACVGLRFVMHGTRCGRKILATLITQIRFWRAHRAHVGGQLHTLCVDFGQPLRRLGCAGLFEQLLDDPLGLGIPTFTKSGGGAHAPWRR